MYPSIILIDFISLFPCPSHGHCPTISLTLSSSIFISIYISVSPKSVRGSISSMFEVTVAFGILLAFLITLGFNTHSVAPDGSYYPDNWRYILGIQAALAIALTLLFIPIPESPRWLVSVGRTEEARAVLGKTR